MASMTRGGAQGHDLRVRGRITVYFSSVLAARHDDAVRHDDTAHGHVTVRRGQRRLHQSGSHKAIVIIHDAEA
jgi:hypothetical protein